jgi:hypothetical protein
MKLNFTRTLAVLAVFTMLYASCKKESKPATNTAAATVDYKALSSQIGLSLYKGITGQYGGTDVTTGIKLPSNINVASHAGLRVNSTASLCGFIVDTAFSSSKTVHDTTTSQSGFFHFVYTCSTTTPDGYMVHDSIANIQSGTNFSNSYGVGQNYTVKALDQTYKIVSMNGVMYTFNNVNQSHPTAYTDIAGRYNLNGLVVNFTSGSADVTSGTATFMMFGYSQGSGVFDDGHPVGNAGTITFIGNHQATLTIASNPGVTYFVNLQTGAVTVK